MNEKTCSRSWEVEAARDGRLSEAARALLEEHVARCEICARERRALEGLAGRLRAGLPGAPDDLSVRRLRRATLERANEAWLDRGAPRERGRRMSLAAAAIAFACVLIGIAWWSPWRAGPTVQVTEGTAADWSRDTSAEGQRVVLREGAIELRTRRDASDPPFFVVVPDGEIQDVGTVFRVEVKGGVTTRIDVSEGAVVFRRPGLPEVRIEAGEHWPHSDPASARAGAGGGSGTGTGASPKDDGTPGVTASASGDPMAPGASGEPATGAPAASAQGAAPIAPSTAAAPGVTATSKGTGTSSPPATGGAAQAGSAKAAASSKPATSSGLEEDIAYLQVIALMRDGRREEARLAAKNYLRRFPNGFRRVEVEAIAR